MQLATRYTKDHRLNPQLLWWVVILFAIALAIIPTGLFQADWVNPGGLPLLGRFFSASLHPELSLTFLQLTLNATIITLAFAVCGTALSLGLGLIGGILSAEICWTTLFPHQGWVRSLVMAIRAALSIPRAIHELIWGLFWVNLLGLDPLVGILAIAIPYGAIVAKVFSEILDETPRQALISLTSSGVAPAMAWLYSLIPQALPNLISYSFYRFECALRSAAVLGIIGAGGLGYEIFLSLQSLRYEQLWTFFYALIALNGIVDLTSALVRHRIGAPTRLTLNLAKAPVSPIDASITRSPSPPFDRVLLSLILVGIVLVPFCFWQVGADMSQLGSGQILVRLQDMGAQVFPIQLSRETLTPLFGLSLQTLAMSILAIAGAGIGGILLSFLAARNFLPPGGLLHPVYHQPTQRAAKLWAWGIAVLTRLGLLVCRAIPAPIWALVLLFILFPGILPGAIALGIHNLGILGRLLAEEVENLDPSPLRALNAQGIAAPLVCLYGVLPLCLARFLAYILYRWEVSLRETVVVGLVGAGGLGRLLTEQLSSFDYSGIVVSLSCFIGLTVAVDLISGMMRRSLR